MIVYHKKDPDFRENPNPKRIDYEWVAFVHTDDFGDVFRLTNHIDWPWWENEEVFTRMAPDHPGYRSTSVGDIVEDSDGKLWMVYGVGFEEVKWDLTA